MMEPSRQNTPPLIRADCERGGGGVGWGLIVKAKTHIKKSTNKYVSINYRKRNWRV